MPSQTDPLLILATDLDGTLVGLDRYLEDFISVYEAHQEQIALLYVTGRNLRYSRQLIDAKDLPEPDYLVTDVGSSIYRDGRLDLDWHDRIGGSWDPVAVETALSGVPGLHSQDVRGPLRLCYWIDSRSQEEVLGILEDLPVKAIVSNHSLLDIVPEGGGKAGALAYLSSRENWPRESILAAGDSLNDLDMLAWAPKAVAVANALEELVAVLPDNVYRATLPSAGGILEALALHWAHQLPCLKPYIPGASAGVS